MPISPISSDFMSDLQSTVDDATSSPTTTSNALITEVTVPKLDGSSKDAAYFDTGFEAQQVKPLVDLSGGVKAPPAAETNVDGGITASDDWETPVA